MNFFVSLKKNLNFYYLFFVLTYLYKTGIGIAKKLKIIKNFVTLNINPN